MGEPKAAWLDKDRLHDEPPFTHQCKKCGTKAALPPILYAEWKARCPRKGCNDYLQPIVDGGGR